MPRGGRCLGPAMRRRRFLKAGGSTAQVESFSFAVPGLACWQRSATAYAPWAGWEQAVYSCAASGLTSGACESDAVSQNDRFEKTFMKTIQVVLVSLVLLSVSLMMLGAAASYPAGQNWTNYVRIGAYGLQLNNTDKIVANAQDSNVFGIEVDNDIPGRYESFVNPEEKLKAIHDVAEKAHRAGNHAFVYIAGTECITATADTTPHTLAKEHPDWLQRKITGEPAIFGGGSAFWIRKGDEDVWVTPYASEWRKTYMQRARQIAGTGIDGIYVDIPYWMAHFDGWEDTYHQRKRHRQRIQMHPRPHKFRIQQVQRQQMEDAHNRHHQQVARNGVVRRERHEQRRQRGQRQAHIRHQTQETAQRPHQQRIRQVNDPKRQRTRSRQQQSQQRIPNHESAHHVRDAL